MSTAAIIAIVIGIAVVLAMVVFVTTARRTDVRGAGALPGETRKRDDAARRARRRPSRPRRRPRRRRAAAEPGTAPARRRRRAAPVPWTPPDPDAIGVSRRMFFNRAYGLADWAGIGAFAAAGFVAFLWPSASGRLRSGVSVGKLDEILRRSPAATGSSTLRGPHLDHRVPVGRAAQGAGDLPASIYPGMDDYGLVALYQKCPHLGCRVPQCDEPLVRVPVPRLAVQPGRREEGRARAARHGPLPDHGRPRRQRPVDTGTVVPGPPIGTNTTGQEAEGPHCITGGGEH